MQFIMIKRIFLFIILTTTTLVLSSCYLIVDTYEFEISEIIMIEVVNVDQEDRENDTVTQTFDELTDEDQLVMDIYALFNEHTYKEWNDYYNQKNRANMESLDETIIIVTTSTASFTIGLATMKYPHLDHYHIEEKAVILSDDLLPLRVMENPLYTDLLELLDIN